MQPQARRGPCQWRGTPQKKTRRAGASDLLGNSCPHSAAAFAAIQGHILLIRSPARERDQQQAPERRAEPDHAQRALRSLQHARHSFLCVAGESRKDQALDNEDQSERREKFPHPAAPVLSYRSAEAGAPVVEDAAGAPDGVPALSVDCFPAGPWKKRKKLESGFSRERVSVAFSPVS